jgi:hypothetical protein
MVQLSWQITLLMAGGRYEELYRTQFDQGAAREAVA